METKSNWISKLNKNPIDWLLTSNPWTKYRTLIDLLDYPLDSSEVISAREEVVKHKFVQDLISETLNWVPMAATRNNDPQLSYFKLRLLSDIGLNYNDNDIATIFQMATEHIQDDFFACRGQIPERPKKGEKYEKPDLSADIWHVSPCNSPIITYSLVALGFRNKEIEKSIETMKRHWENEIGWFCNFFFVDGQFKKVKAGCPMAGIMALDVFSLFPDLKESHYSKNAFVPIKFHKDYGKTLYYFGRSKKFWTFKYPFVWYNGLYLADVLSRFDFIKESPLLKECIDWIIDSQNEEGKFKPTSIFMPYKHWDFGNKKETSPWITFLCCRILKRYFDSN